MIIFDAVSVIYGEKAALSEVSFSIEPGEFVFLVGPSGAGKTTIAKLLIGEIRPSSGNIKVGDYDFSKVRRKDIPYLRRQIGMVFQDNKLLHDRTAAENIALPLEILNKSQITINDAVHELLTATGLDGKDNFFPRQLSGGEVQRVVIARALAVDPAVIFADEPTGNLDDETADNIIELLDKINQQGTTVIMSTHDLSLVKRMKKRIIEIKNGEIVSDSQPKKQKEDTEEKQT